MSCGGRMRQDSECSTVSSDSCLLDGSGQSSAPYACALPADEEAGLWMKRAGGARHSKGRNRTRCLAVASLCISVVCILSSGTMFILIFKLRQDSKGGHGLPDAAAQFGEAAEVCMPCDELKDGFREDDANLLDQTVGDDGSSTCCASTPAQYAALFKLILRRQQEVKNVADMMASSGLPESKDGLSGTDDGRGRLPKVNITSGNAVSAHLISKPFNPKTIRPEDLVKQQWKSDLESPISHVRPGLRFHENNVYVQVEGLYFVYCQILYTKTAAETGFPSATVSSNYVKRFSSIYPSSSGILLKARHTSVENDRHSSWVGGLFYLHPQDKLWVEVAAPELVAHDDSASFFGLFRIGN